MIELSVMMPFFRAKYIGWLPFEGLIRQKDIDFEWEIILAEETQMEAFGKERVEEYRKRLEDVGCVKIIYIPLDKWIHLADKISLMAKQADPESKAYVGNPSDYFSPHVRLTNTRQVFQDPQVVWYIPRKAIHYLIRNGTAALQDTTFARRKDHVVGRATAMHVMRTLPVHGPRSGVDGWMFRHMRRIVRQSSPKLKKVPDLSDMWKYGLSTIGFNNISPKGRLPTMRGRYMTPYLENLRECIPSEVMDRLEESKKYLNKHSRTLPSKQNG